MIYSELNQSQQLLASTQRVLADCVNQIKKSGGRIGKTQAQLIDGHPHISIESNQLDICQLIINCTSDKLWTVASQIEYLGEYMWDADLYVKPQGSVWFVAKSQ